MKLATKFLRVSVMLCLLVWITYPTVKETAHHPKPELPKISLEHKASKHVDQKRNQHPASSALATTQQQVSELAPALKWLTPYLAPASDRARGQKWLSPFVPSITASKTATQFGTDLGTPGPTPGDVLRYVVVIKNAVGAMDATAVQFTDQIDANTTLVPGSLVSAPIAIDDSYSTVGNTSISVPAASGLIANDVNLNGTPMSATAIDQTGTMGTVTANPDGSFTFNPSPGFEGTTTFTYTVSNGAFASVGTVTVTVTGMIWYINASAAAGGDGRLNTPFNTINDFNATSLDGTGDNIFVYSGTYNNTSSTILLGQQKLIGQGAVGASLAALAGVTFSTHPPISPATIPTVGGTRPTINQAANNTNMQSQNQVRGVNLNNTGGTALLANGFTSATVREVSITNTGGVGVNFNNGSLDVIIQSITASNSTNAISVTNTTGSFQVTGTGTTDGSGGTLTSISGRGIDLRTATNITLKNMTLTSANTADGGAAGVCDEVNVLGCFAAIYMDGVNTVTLDNIDIGGTEEHGIMGNSVNNLSINNCTSTNNGNLDDENALKFRNLSGTCSITGSTFQNSAFRVCHIINTTGNVNLTVSNCVFNNTAASAVGQDCFEMRTQGSATATVNLIGSSFQRARSKGIQIQAEGTSTINANITYCRVERFTGAMAGIDVASNGAVSTINYNINNNVVIESSGEVAVLASTLNSTLNGRLNRNLSIDNNYPLAGGSTFAITRVLHDGSSVAKLEMKGNLSVTGNNLDLPVDFQSINGTNSAHRFDAIIDSNIISNNASGGVGIEGMFLRVGTSAAGGKINTLCGDVTRNKVTVPASAGGRAFRANRIDASSFLTLSGTSPVATMWPGNGNSNVNGSLNTSAGVVFTGVAPPGCNGPIHASFAPSNEEIASIVNDGTLNDQALNSGAYLNGQQKNAPVKPKTPKEKEAEPASLQMVMSGETVTVGAPSGFPLPAGKQITIRFEVTINTPLPAGVCQISNQGSVSGSNFTTILTDDPGVAGASDPTVTTLSKHSLGNLVFRDNNKNGSFDGGDVGIPAVVVNLYRDNGTTPGILDATDAFVTTTNTVAGGLYLFTNLCSDEYIVQIPSSEFGPGEPLNGLISSPTGAAPDPDNGTDSDDNGQDAISSSIASQAITINYSTSFVENNTTLDFGFKSPTLVTINDVTMNEGSGGGTTNFTFTVNRDDISEAFSLDVNTGVISTNNGDYTAISGGTVSFTAGGSNTATVTVVVNADDIVELTETFNVLLSNAPAGVVITDGTGLGTITNDDQATLSINSVSKTEGNSGIELYIFTVTSDKAVDVPFTVNVGTVDGTATTADGDYVANSATLSFVGTAGETQTFQLIVNRDTKVEPTETFTVPLSTVSAGGRNVVISGPSGTGTGTITNDDSATISINDVSLVEGNAGTTNFVFNVTLSEVVSTAVTVNFTTANGTAGAGDYNTNSGMVTFPANGAGQTQTITVQVLGDVVGEANETFFVNLSNVTGSPDVSILDAQGVGTILDDDLSFSINDVTLAEGNAGTTNFTFTVTRTSTATAETIDFTTANNTATTGDNDYALNSGTLNFAIGDNSETITVVVNGDNKVELNETFFVNLSNVSNGSISDAQGLGTINNDDQATITVNSLSKTEGDAGSQNYDFTVTLDKEIDVAISVNITTSNILATSGSGDFVANSTTLNFAGTAGETKTFTVAVNGDMIVEPDENFGVVLSNLLASSRNVTLGAAGNGTILNDDAATISIDNVTKVEGNAGTTDFEFTVTLSKVVSTAVSFDFTTAGITATSGVDFVPNSNTITFPANGAGQTQTITVPVNGDVLGEANETFTVDLSNIVGSPSVTFADAQGLGTIEDDDLAFSIDDVSIAEGNAGTTNLVFTVTRTSIATAETIDFTTANNTATTGDNDYVLNSGTLNFAIGDDTETITVVLTGDTKVELNETFFVNLSNASNGAISDAQGVGTITNDDQATLTIDNVSKTEGDAGTQTYTFTVSVDKAVDVPFSVNVGTVDGTATAGTDYVTNSTTLNFAGIAATDSKTFDVTVNGDMLVEPNELFTVPLSAVSASGRNVVISGSSGTGTGTITNDDAATISIDNVTMMEGDAGTVNFVFNVTLSKVVSTAVTVDFATAGITATSGVDFNPNSNTITFPANGAGQTQTITVQVVGDVLGEANETFTVDLSNILGSASVTFADAQGLGTIEDDDLAFSINDLTIAEGNAGTTNFTFTVTRTSTATAETIQYATANNTATTADNDYTSTSGTLNFAIGDDTETFTVVINGDLKVEANETFFVNLSNPSNGAISDGQGIGTINNDDAAVVHLQLLSATKAEGNAGTTNFTFTATLNNPVQGGFDLAYTTDDATATTANSDYQDNDGTMSFTGTANEQKTITVLVNGDTDVELDETFTVSIENNGFSNTALAASLSTASTVIATIQNDDSDIDAGLDTTICASTIMIPLRGTVSGASTGGTWTTSGTGSFIPNANDLNAKYMFSVADTAAGTVTLTLTGNGPSGEFDVKIVTIDPASIVNAGPDQTICATDTIYLSATLSGVANALVWQKNAAFGDFVGSDTSPNAKYVLNATGQQLSSIKFGVMSNDPGGNVCQGGLDTVQIFINPAAYVDAGVDTTICASTVSIKLKGSISGEATTATWTTSGTGTFSPNATTLNATYTPSLADTAAGTVTLTLTTNDPAGLCGPAVDTKIITIDPASIVNAGPDQTICATDTIYLSATLSGVADALVWQKNAAFGTFIGSDTSPNAKYVLNATGQQLSSIKFGVMSSDPGGNVCQGGLDTVQIFINPAAYVDAGVDTTICASTISIKLKGSISGAATSATWTTSGTGTFSPNATTLNATYTPSLADTAAGTVTLTLTTNDPAGLCGPAVDTKIITIDPASIVNAGPDQTICATDTIYLSATLSGVADALVWQKNAAFGTFIGSDTSPNAKYVLNATGQQLSSIKFGVMSSDPGGNVCQGGLDTVEIFISDPIDASVSIDLDTVCVGGAFTMTFNESTLPQGSEFTVVVKYTDENGAGSKTLSNISDGDQTIFEEGVDFDGILTVTQIVVTPETAGFCADTLDGFKVEVVVCEATIVDPCVCQNNAQIGQNGTNSNTGTFKDVVRIEGPINQTWTVASVSGLYEDAAGTNPVDVGDAFTQVSPGVYELVGYHIDAIGYSIAVTNGRGVTLEANNKCFYPNPVFTGLPALVAPSAAPFQVTGTVADNVAGTGTFILDGVPQAGASPAPTVLTINPGTLAPGPHTLVYSFDAGVAASKDSLDPGCVQQVRQRFQVANCGCQDVTVSLNENCQFLLTGNLVSDVNCGGGTVRVMDNDPSNGGLIDCAGVWTYGLFDAFGNIICWGKVTAEDKTAPALVCAPADITLDCYDVNYVLNNRLTIGNTNATSSPRPAATSPQTINNAEGVAGTGDNCQLGLAPPSLVSDNIKNLGYAYFKDNCYNCGCRITLKWSDKVEFYSCEQMKVNGGYYALISREWTATDCNGMRSSYVQKIKFTRPTLDDFVFNGPGEGKYDRVVEYNSCTPDKSLIKKEDVTPYVCSYFNTSANPRCLFIDQVECNYSVSIKDTEFPICGGKGVKIDRELYVLDWCAGGIVDTFHILIKIGDFQAPTVEYAHGAPYDISTGPMDCTAAIPVSVAGIKTAFGVTIKDNCNLGNISVSVYTKDRYVKGILVYEGPEDPICIEANRKQAGELRGDHEDYRLGDCTKEDDICWDKVEYAVMNGMMIGLPVGKHLMVIEAFDGCYNASTTCFVFEVKDKIAPIMKCDDDLHVTLSNANGYTNGYAQVSAADIDEGSWDNCKLAWIAVRRNVPDGCAASFIAKGYDTNGNGKLDALPADGDVSKADGFDRNGDGDIADFGETFILKGGKLMTPMLDFVEFFCCDLTERVTVELWGGDIYGNTNYCWMDLLIEDKVAPTCLAPWDVTVYCDDKNIASIDSKAGSAAAFGDVLIPPGNDCAALDTVYTTEKKLKCGAGYIDRIWTLTKQTVKGPISVTCKQRIHILPVHEYNICFPKDVSTDCKTPVIDTVITDELGCDILAVNVHDKRYDASDDECYKIFRTYSVINWCTYDDRCGDPLEQTNISIIDRAVFGNYGKAPIYVLVRDREDNRRDGVEEFYISKDLIHNNADDIRFKPKYCEVAGEFYHSFIYTQIIKVYDDTRPVVTGTRDTFCTSPTACTANITKVVTLKDNCTDKVELETQFLMIAPFQTLEAGQMILYSTPRWSTKDLGNGQFEIKVSNLPEGTHDLIVVGRDECGNLSLPTRIPFVVKDCKAPAPICINGLSVDLMPDGNGGGMMTVWASDFVASKIYDCNGQGPETKDGLKLITKYSVNRVLEPVNPNQTSISVNCADLELGFILVELHAWDNAGNHDFCVTFIEVQDNRKVCPTPADKVKIAGTIATEGAGNLQGVSVTLSGSGTQSDMTGTDGNYEFVNITKGGDFTVTPQLDKNHLNGVSTFDLVLIQKHILGVQALNSPYKMIAADANNSKSISTLDLIQIRKLILNIDTHFANNTSWRFVDATYRFPTPTNPWSASFPEVVSVNDLVTNVRANFVAIKVGDVNASASVNGAASAEIRTSEDFKLKTLEQNLKSGNEYKVTFTAADLKNIQGYQFALNLDQSKVELLDIEYGVAKAENFGMFKNEGIITTSWNSKYEPGALFTLVLRAKADAKLSQTLSLNRLVSPEAYDQHNGNLGIALNFEGIQASEAYELRQNTPNPFSDETVIGFTLPKALKGTLTVRDVKGALIYKVEGNYAKGNNQVTLKKSQLGASGVLYYTLETTDFTATKKMVILE